MSNVINNETILKRLQQVILKHPDLNFHEILNKSGCSPIEFLKDVSNPNIGKYGVKDKRAENSIETLSRINNTIRINKIG